MSTDRIAIARASFVAVFAAMAVGVSLFARQDSSPALDLFQQALAKERAEGDLTSAIALYERVVAEAGGDRAMAGRALLHMADCYAKLGSPEARTIYDRIVSQFADQPDLIARARAALTPNPKAPAPALPAGLVTKPVGVGARLIDAPAGRPSPDARWIAVRSQQPDGPRLALLNQISKQVREIVRSGADGDLCGEPVWSRDSTGVVYPWCPRAAVSSELRISNVNGGAARVLVVNSPALLQPLDWSADGQSILAWTGGSGGSGDLALIGVANGSVRMLGARGVTRPMTTAAALSPDGRFAVLTPDTSERGILVVDIGRGTVQPLVASPNHDVFLGWHPDGQHLLLISDRLGTFDVWSAVFADGALQGAPVPIATDVGPITSLGLTSAGALYYAGAAQQPSAVTDLFLAATDPSSDRVISAAQRIVRPGTGHLIHPVWSADGKQIAYKVGASADTTTGAIEILTLATGQERHVLPRVAGTLGQFDWSRDGRQFVASYAQGDRQSIYLIDTESGVASVVMTGARTPDPTMSPGRGNLSQPRWMANGESIAVVMNTRIVVHRIATGEDQTVVDGQVQITSLAVSPDGRSFVYLAGGEMTVASVSDGRTYRLASLGPVPSARLLTWSADSKFVVFSARTAAATVPGTTARYSELWRVPAAGGTQEPLNLAADSIIQPAMSSDGRWVVFSVNADISPAVHVLELVRLK